MKKISNQKITSKEILEELEEENIKQIPRWMFILKNIVFWLLWVVFVIFGGSLTVSSVIFHIQFSGWEYYPVTHSSLGNFLIDAVPYVWIILFIIFLSIGFENIRHTRRGYKYAFSALITLSLLLSVAGGTFLNALGAGRFVEDHLGGHIPFDREPPGLNEGLWNGAEKGLLAGTISWADQGGGRFMLEEFDQSQWLIDATQLSDDDWNLIEQGSEIRVVGLPYNEGDEFFVSCFVFSWDNTRRPPGDPGFIPPPSQPCSECQHNMADIKSCDDVPSFDFLR
ncbi:MAG: hypothetical protein A2W97_07805 [Bacteroidetes bacterium GWE2_40_63]|nr:MAG: hypothetical protein A2W97_07805 [Bacteroidetes bacterium GWE2_40_63]OFY30252.1 MAG: hypothetical protein A2X09_13615 [Bacteroidetes bacterium GWF2_43_11]HCT86356.1 hypothetical protein [Candidatus Margulisiibacteriota bacterium]